MPLYIYIYIYKKKKKTKTEEIILQETIEHMKRKKYKNDHSSGGGKWGGVRLFFLEEDEREIVAFVPKTKKLKSNERNAIEMKI